jgi:tetratricopeptide (TPR) repeat protein
MKKIYPNNPLGIIAVFVFFIEAITTVSLSFLQEHHDLLKMIIIFIIVFPSFIALMFFSILIFKREILFAPSDYKDEDNFMQIITKNFEKLETQQKVLQVVNHPPTKVDDVYKLVDKLLEQKEYKNIVRIGRAYLKLDESKKCFSFFDYVSKKLPNSEDFYYTMIANCAYSKIKLEEYEIAIEYLEEVESILGSKTEVWHLNAMAFALFKLGRNAKYLKYLERAKEHISFKDELKTTLSLYPELEADLTKT